MAMVVMTIIIIILTIMNTIKIKIKIKMMIKNKIKITKTMLRCAFMLYGTEQTIVFTLHC